MEPEILLPCSQNTVITFCSEAVNILILSLFNIFVISPSHLRRLSVFSSEVSQLKSSYGFLIKFRVFYLLDSLSSRSLLAMS
jgi:hypothetical protein